MTTATQRTATRRTIAVLGSGDMGSAVGGALVRAGFRAVTNLTQRSALSRELAERQGVEDVGSLDAVVRAAELVLSIVPPGAALVCAEDAAAAMRAARVAPPFADCNAVSPDTVRKIARVLDTTGAPFIDACIVGNAPRPGAKPTRVYASGSARRALLDLEVPELQMGDLGGEIGAASALKMVYAGLNKGTDALHTAVLLAGERLGVLPALLREFESSQSDVLARMRAKVPFLASTSARFADEMAEIAATFASAGVTPDFHRGAQWVHTLLATTPLAAEPRAHRPRERSLDAALAVFTAALDARGGAR